MKDLLLIIDMQNVYLPGQPWACPSIPDILPNILSLLDSPLCGSYFDVIFTQYTAPENPRGRWKQYNEAHKAINENVWQNQMISELKPYLKHWPLYKKSTYSSCSVPQIMDTIENYGRIALCGVIAECCILATAEALIDAGAHVCYLKDAVSGQSSTNEDVVIKLMESFSPIHTKVLTVREYLSYCKRMYP